MVTFPSVCLSVCLCQACLINEAVWSEVVNGSFESLSILVGPSLGRAVTRDQIEPLYEFKQRVACCLQVPGVRHVEGHLPENLSCVRCDTLL